MRPGDGEEPSGTQREEVRSALDAELRQEAQPRIVEAPARPGGRTDVSHTRVRGDASWASATRGAAAVSASLCILRPERKAP